MYHWTISRNGVVLQKGTTATFMWAARLSANACVELAKTIGIDPWDLHIDINQVIE